MTTLSKDSGKNKQTIYMDGLDPTEKKRYVEKIMFIDGKDPLDPSETKNWTRSCEDILPAIKYFDLCNYLVYGTSAYTQEQFNCYKGLEAYNQFCCGWVSDRAAYVCKDNKHVVVSAKVLHSQRMREKPLRPWIAATKEGVIRFAHCDCMAGCGEVCTHVSALLFSIEYVVKIRESRTVTEKPAYWKLPSEFKQIKYCTLAEMDFTSAKMMKKNLDKKISSSHDPEIELRNPDPAHCEKGQAYATDDELDNFYKSLFATGTKPVLLSTVHPYCDHYIPKSVTAEYPPVLSTLYDEDMLYASYEEIKEKCKNINIDATEKQVKQVETETRLQYKSRLWNRFRAGRITASRAKAVVKTDQSNPSLSLLKSVCYPEQNKFSTPATKWGCDHEATAKAEFIRCMKPFHDNLTCQINGLYIDPNHPYLGASPDAILSCDCCGKSVIEIKCPFCLKNSSDISDVTLPYLNRNDDGTLSLDRKHAHFYQVQTQLGVTGLEAAFFVVWSPNDIHIERISFSSDLYNEIVEKAKLFFENAVLPEIVSKFFTRKRLVVADENMPSDSRCKPLLSDSFSRDSNTLDRQSEQSVAVTAHNDDRLDSVELWCFCRQGEYGKMVCCDNENCTIQWFHYKCVGISRQPKGQWFCSDCKPVQQQSKRCRKK